MKWTINTIYRIFHNYKKHYRLTDYIDHKYIDNNNDWGMFSSFFSNLYPRWALRDICYVCFKFYIFALMKENQLHSRQQCDIYQYRESMQLHNKLAYAWVHAFRMLSVDRLQQALVPISDVQSCQNLFGPVKLPNSDQVSRPLAEGCMK